MSKHMAPQRSGANPVLLAVIAGVIVAAFAAVVIVATAGDDDDSSIDTADGSATGTIAAGFDTATAQVQGEALPDFPGAGADPALGMDAPTATGMTQDGSDLTTPAQGRPTMLLFLAHWCPHCQEEIKTARDWVADGNLPDDVDLAGVATHIDPARPNHPPSAWFLDEDWAQPTIADADAAVATTYGLTELPYWVIVDADGKVVDRRGGEQTETQIDEMLAVALGDQ